MSTLINQSTVEKQNKVIRDIYFGIFWMMHFCIKKRNLRHYSSHPRAQRLNDLSPKAKTNIFMQQKRLPGLFVLILCLNMLIIFQFFKQHLILVLGFLILILNINLLDSHEQKVNDLSCKK
ncbi:hypothetical protein Bca4012_071402 [Brassica carinata]